MYANLADLSVSEEVFFPYNNFVPIGDRRPDMPAILQTGSSARGIVIAKKEDTISLKLFSCERQEDTAIVTLKIPHYCRYEKLKEEPPIAGEPPYYQLTFDDIG